MANLSNAVEQQKKSMRVLARAKNGRFVSVNPLRALAELPAAPATAPETVESSERALLVAALIDSQKAIKANASGYAKSSYTKKGSYSYVNGYYGTFASNENRVVSYAEITGMAEPESNPDEAAYVESQVATNSDATKVPVTDSPDAPANVPGDEPANEEKGIKAIWAKYKKYIIITVVVVLAVVAYKKLS